MKEDASLLDRFEGWFATPIERLKAIPEGDGAFLAMSAALFLCERYYRTLTNTYDGKKDDLTFRKAAAADFDIAFDEFEKFWKVYRHGIQHQGLPKKVVDPKSTLSYHWEMHDSYTALPVFVSLPNEDNVVRIRINPWKFAALVCGKYRSNPKVLELQELAVTYDTYD